MIKVLFFATLREKLDCHQINVDTQKTVSSLISHLSERSPLWKQTLSGQVLCAVNQQMATLDDALNDGDEVAFFPPVTGG
ncbi:molybdopterin converting factor subunit 1 [Thalassotalea sediminis]|uniref:molybdopterin converting factor subunit 1 n=1 Tax=Thalassotalea sediminis TaxID=1759089 RepID=UPI0025744030|nr:molybdopterin converting factor subunit 1 [Thalassotalea sediminis]